MSAEKLYTPELLALTVELARYPAIADAALRGEARSKTCGSTIALDLVTDGEGRVERVGMLVRACAVGQAAAAIFARAAPGRDLAQIHAAHDAIAQWLDGSASIADWPGLDAIAAARDYPGRHGAIMLPWNAAIAALSSTAAAS